VLRQICLAVFLAAISPAMLAADGQETTEVKGVIQQFHQALDRHDVAAIEALVSADVVVLENGHRNDGWPDFRDNHLIPEFKEPATPSKWEFVKVAASSEMAWGYTKQTISATGKDGKAAGYLVWSAYVLQKAGSTWKVVLLDWSVRRLNEAN
jgi:ketosteroid isomerase-like protein